MSRLVDLTPVPERALVDVDALERAVQRLAAAGAAPGPGDKPGGVGAAPGRAFAPVGGDAG
ncbi:MAG: hypothetical protein QOH72_2491 [Solirubrobacteraceae bacterium]|jgi:hypothetical protein|nr:hypothetical protein [Solirubrobacteraceae bacterium]